MDHGTNFEKHALETLCGEIMPALLPPCYAYFEVDTKVMDGPKNTNLITVSPDGILQCTMGERKCKFYKKHHHRRITIEFKAHTQMMTYHWNHTTKFLQDMFHKCYIN